MEKIEITEDSRMNKYEALEYLVKNEFYVDEWTGATMYEHCKKIFSSDKKSTFSKSELDLIIKEIKSNF